MVKSLVNQMRYPFIFFTVISNIQLGVKTLEQEVKNTSYHSYVLEITSNIINWLFKINKSICHDTTRDQI